MEKPDLRVAVGQTELTGEGVLRCTLGQRSWPEEAAVEDLGYSSALPSYQASLYRQPHTNMGISTEPV